MKFKIGDLIKLNSNFLNRFVGSTEKEESQWKYFFIILDIYLDDETVKGFPTNCFSQYHGCNKMIWSKYIEKV